MVAAHNAGVALAPVFGHLVRQSAFAFRKGVGIAFVVAHGVHRAADVGVHAHVAAEGLDERFAPVLALHRRVQDAGVGRVFGLCLRRQVAAVLEGVFREEAFRLVVRLNQRREGGVAFRGLGVAELLHVGLLQPSGHIVPADQRGVVLAAAAFHHVNLLTCHQLLVVGIRHNPVGHLAAAHAQHVIKVHRHSPGYS